MRDDSAQGRRKFEEKKGNEKKKYMSLLNTDLRHSRIHLFKGGNASTFTDDI